MSYRYKRFSLDWVGVNDPWAGVNVDLVALQSIVCQVLHVPQCGPPVAIGLQQPANYARLYSFQLTSRSVVARVVAPVKPLFKTESEVAAMDFVRSHTSLPIPRVFAYYSEASNPVGAEWLIMEYMPGVEMGTAWDGLQLRQKQKLALDIIDLYDQLHRLKADGCGSIYHSVDSVDDSNIWSTSSLDSSNEIKSSRRSLRWTPLSSESIRMLRSHCRHPIHDSYDLGPLNDISILDYRLRIPSPSQTLPVFSTDDYVKLLAFAGNPSTRRSALDIACREKCIELLQGLRGLYPHSTVLGPPADEAGFCFTHGDLHDGNILIDPKTGAITGIIDWEAAAFRPPWTEITGVGWFEEDGQRIIRGDDEAGNFEDDVDPEDPALRAFFRTEMYRRNPDLFWCFLGGVELRAVRLASVDVPLPDGQTILFLRRYYCRGYWNEIRRGPYPYDAEAWGDRAIELSEAEMARVQALEANALEG